MKVIKVLRFFLGFPFFFQFFFDFPTIKLTVTLIVGEIAEKNGIHSATFNNLFALKLCDTKKIQQNRMGKKKSQKNVAIV